MTESDKLQREKIHRAVVLVSRMHSLVMFGILMGFDDFKKNVETHYCVCDY